MKQVWRHRPNELSSRSAVLQLTHLRETSQFPSNFERENPNALVFSDCDLNPNHSDSDPELFRGDIVPREEAL